MEFISERTIKLSKQLNDLDFLVLKFVRILEKYVDYVIISGYVAILLGRSRGTEDIDIFIKPLAKETLSKLYTDLKEHGFWCLNAEQVEDIDEYLRDGIAIRFARTGETIPNFEVKFTVKRIDGEIFNDDLIVETTAGPLHISSLERQIAFKKYYLKSDKDLEDARHLEQLFKEQISSEKIKKYKDLIHLTYGKT